MSEPLRTRTFGADLPAGTVTFLLTDIEGSTRRWEQQGAAMATAVGRHYEILDAAVHAHGGVRPIEQGEGDSMVAAFARASDAVAAALDAQLMLRAQSWPAGADVAVRMAVHTGEAQLREEKYYVGPSIIRCARLRGLGHGGQVLISGATADLLAEALPAGASLLPLGAHRMRDLPQPSRVFQLAHPDLPAAFPPLRSLDALPNNLPVQLTSFIGRRQERHELIKQADEHRLISLVGPGGSGKTRLAGQVAAQLLEARAGGVWWVDLSPVTDPALVATAVMGALGIGDDRGSDPLARVVECLGDQPVLLVLDNCEHLVDGAARVVEQVLRSCPAAGVLATSREPLGVPSELTWRVTPLSLPSGDRARGVEVVRDSEAVQLFVERCREVRPSFQLDATNAAAVAAICTRLDGLPLAIELAAARIRSLSAERILTELSDRFRLLTGGARTALARQQTLQASVEWSHHLLSEREQIVFRRLAACLGGFTLEAAESIAADEQIQPWEILDVLSDLVDKSLVCFDGDRYSLLQTLHQFASAQLLNSGEADSVRDAHARYFLARAEEAAEMLTRDARDELIVALEVDHDNLRATLEWTLEHADDEWALRLIVALGSFWYVQSHYTEGLTWHRRVLSRVPADRSVMRCRAVASLGMLSLNCADLSNALGYPELAQAAEMARELDDPALLARPLAALSRFQVFGLPGDAVATLAEAMAAARAAGDEWAVSNVLWWQAFHHVFARDRPELAEPVLVELDELAARAESVSCRGWSDIVRQIAAARAGRLAGARQFMESALAAAESCGDVLLESYAFAYGTDTLIALGDYAFAERAVLRTVARLRRHLDACRQGVVEFGLVRIALARGDLSEAARWVEEMRTLMRTIGLPFGLEWLCAAEGRLALEAGDLPAARPFFHEAMASATATGVPWSQAHALHDLGLLAVVEGDTGAAEDCFHRALALDVEYGFAGRATDTLEALAVVAASNESSAEAVRLLAAADGLRLATGQVRATLNQPRHDAVLAALRAEVPEDTFAQWWTEGAGLSLVDVVAWASRARGERKRPSSGWAALTPTELDVVALAATGATNAEIGVKLFMSATTAKTHLQHVYAKLGVANRAALAAEASRRMHGRE